jgi:hypothetical protein
MSCSKTPHHIGRRPDRRSIGGEATVGDAPQLNATGEGTEGEGVA